MSPLAYLFAGVIFTLLTVGFGVWLSFYIQGKNIDIQLGRMEFEEKTGLRKPVARREETPEPPPERKGGVVRPKTPAEVRNEKDETKSALMRVIP